MIYTHIKIFATGCLLVLAALTADAAPQLGEVFQAQDVVISGREMHHFVAEGRAATIVLGDFTLMMEDRTFTGDDAVLWITERMIGGQSQREIILYIENKARLVEANATIAQNDVMLVKIVQKGRLRADVGARVDTSLAHMPLYQRAAAMRSRMEAEQPPASPARASDQDSDIPAMPSRPVQGDHAELDQIEPEQVDPQQAVPPVEQPQTQPQAPVAPVTFRADSLSSEEIGEQRVTVAKGNVYISQGAPLSAEFIELRAQSAVIFSEQVPPEQRTADGQSMRIVGAYLENDVIMARGERTVQGSRLYYDFIQGRAVILDAVLWSVQTSRNVPIVVRAPEARQLSPREVWFRNARVSTSEFYTPSYHIGASRAYLRDDTPTEPAEGIFERGEALGEPRYTVEMTHTTFNVGGVPFLYWPYLRSRGEVADTPLRRVQVGEQGRFGWGVETEWYLFRLLGLIEPEGFKGAFNLDVYEEGIGIGSDLDYYRDTYSGYSILYGVRDFADEDRFGQRNRVADPPDLRGRALWRHRQFLDDGWQLQLEFSYLCDRNFLRQYYPSEFWTGKEQDTLLYAKKQENNWAFTTLLQGQINHFQPGPEAAPDLGFLLVGESLWEDRLSFYSESRAGLVRFNAGDPIAPRQFDTANLNGRLDQRAELNAPMHFGPLNLVPYTMGRLTYWGRAVDESDLLRGFGSGGIKTNMHFWRVYNDAHSRLLNIDRLKHVITPEGNVFLSASNVATDELYPISPGIEQHLEAFQGFNFGFRQRWQTYRGAPGRQRVTDLLQANLFASFFTDTKDPNLPADGRWFFDRPEYSLTRNAINGDMIYHISDTTAMLADFNYDTNDRKLGIGNAGLAVQRDPRLRYYLGIRYIEDLDSAAGTFGFSYKINRKYQVNAFQQYDFRFNDGENLATRISLVRKWPRWFTAFTVYQDRATGDWGFVVTLWPEGAPEFRIGGSRFNVAAFSEQN